MHTDLFTAVRDEEQDAGHDTEHGKDNAAFRERDVAEMDQAREDQPGPRRMLDQVFIRSPRRGLDCGYLSSLAAGRVLTDKGFNGAQCYWINTGEPYAVALPVMPHDLRLHQEGLRGGQV